MKGFSWILYVLIFKRSILVFLSVCFKETSARFIYDFAIT